MSRKLRLLSFNPFKGEYKIDFLGDKSPKLWPIILNPFRKQKYRLFLSFFINIILNLYLDRGDNPEKKSLKCPLKSWVVVYALPKASRQLMKKSNYRMYEYIF